MSERKRLEFIAQNLIGPIRGIERLSDAKLREIIAAAGKPIPAETDHGE